MTRWHLRLLLRLLENQHLLSLNEIEAERKHALYSALLPMIVNPVDDRVSLMHQHFCTVAVYMSEVDALNDVRALILDLCFMIEEVALLNSTQRDELREQVSHRIEECLPRFKWDVIDT